MHLALFAPRLPSLVDSLQLLQKMADERPLAAAQQRPSAASQAKGGQGRDAKCRDPGQPVGSYHRKRRARGYDGAKRLNGRKRHLLVDTLGLLLRIVVLPANISDREGAKRLLTGLKAQFPRLSCLWADQGYRGQKFCTWVRHQVGCRLIVMSRPKKKVWLGCDEMPHSLGRMNIQPRRWVVERTFAWAGRCRRLSKDYEGLPETEEALVSMAMVRLMLKRLTR